MRKLKKILLIDDDKINNFINKKLLDALEIAEEVVECNNGKKALDHLLKCRNEGNTCPEFIILDNFMPVMDGDELLEHLYETGFFNKEEVVVLVLVAQTRVEEIERYRQLGVKEFSYKPLSAEIVMNIYNKYWAAKANNTSSNII